MITRVLLVDDEPPARERLKGLLAPHSDFRLVGEARNGLEALELIDKLHPDLLFLDMQMPGLTGLEVLQALPEEHGMQIIFSTAYDQYAMEAFDHHALDYLLKPTDRVRFEKAVDKARTMRKAETVDDFGAKLKGLLREYEQAQSASEKPLIVKEAGKVQAIYPSEIIFAESEANYVALQTFERRHFYRATMGEMETMLPEGQFVRIHRSFMVNKGHVKGVDTLSGGQYQLSLSGGHTLVSSRTYSEMVAVLA